MHLQIQKSEDGSQKSEVRSQRSRVRISAFCFLFSVLLIAGGCSKSPDHQPSTINHQPSAPTPLAPDSVLRVHWVGKQTLGTAASAYSFMRLWNLPETKQVEAQLLGKLCNAPWQRAANEPPAANNASAALQPLLDDILNEETCLEVRESNGAQQLVLAVRVNNTSATRWMVNLADVLSSLEGTFPTKRGPGWFLNSARTKTAYELERAGAWIVVGAAKGTNGLFQEIVARIGREQSPFTVTATNHWLAADVDLRWLGTTANIQHSTFNAQLPKGRMSLVVSGDGANTVTTGELVFPEPLQMNLAPWKFPKAQVQGPVVEFGAIRGLGPWLPDQVFTWADARTPLQMHFAAVDGRANEFAKLAEAFLPKGNAWLANHGLGTLAKTPGTSGIIWKDLPMIAPHLTATSDSLLTGGLVPNPEPGTNAPVDIYPRPTLDELLATLASKTNLVAYQWETTGARAESMHFLGQILRVSTRHPQMPAGTASSVWLQNVRQRLGNCTTLVTLTAPNRLAFERTSTTGFNAVELHLIADWMESPLFPRGSYTGLSPIGPASAK